MTTYARKLLPVGLLLALPLAARPALPTPAACVGAGTGTLTCDLWVKAGTVTVPGSAAAIPVWGYSDTETGPAQLPGPTIVATAGDTLMVNLHNTLGEVTSLLFAGQDQAAGGPEAPPLAGTTPGAASYTLPGLRPGTFLYQAAPLVHDPVAPALVRSAQHQAAMGLFGALVVRPAAVVTPPAGQAYEDPATAFADEALVVLSELDPIFAANPAAFDLRNHSPRYRLINGKAFPATDPIPATAGATTLLRYLNAGLQHHSMALLGLDQAIIAQDGSPLSIPRRAVAETIAPGQTLDALATVPAAAAAGSQYPLYDGSLLLVNSSGLGASAGFGGMLTFLTVGTGTPPPTGPAVTNVALAPNPSSGAAAVALSATVGAGATAAEYYLDSLASAPSPMVVLGPSATATIDALVVAALASGSHNVYVRAADGTTWGSANFAVLVIDRTGPSTTGLALSPSVTAGAADVAVTATADDRPSGGAAIAAAELSIDGGAASPLTATPALSGPLASLTGTIPAATLALLPSGPHAVSVRSQDALGNWGAAAGATLLLDRTGPTASLVSLAPNPSNGRVGVNSSTAAVRVTATLADTQSTVAGGEAFIDTVGVNGTGFGMVPGDGAFDGPSEAAFGDIPLSTVVQLTEGNHTVSVRGRDAAGNWGAIAAANLLVDKTAPTIAGLTAAPNPTNTTVAPFTSNTSFTLTATGSDTATGIAGGEWFEGADPGPGNGRPMTGAGPVTATVSFAAWTAGSHTLTARLRDGAGNWSATLNTNVDVVLPDALFASSFESAASPWGWTSATGANLSVVATPASFPASAGAQVLRAAFGGGAGARYVTDASPVQETSYRARFYFHPNGSLPVNTATPTLFAGLNAANGAIFQVQYRRQGAGAGAFYQVRAGALQNVGGTAFTAWTTIPSASATPIEIAWQAAAAGPPRLQLTVGAGPGQAILPLNVNTGAQRLEAVRLGLAAGLAAGASGSVYLDAFVSTRRSTIGP